MKTKIYSEVWNLDEIFLGGSHSVELKEHLHNIEREIATFEKTLQSFQVLKEVESVDSLASLLKDLQSIRMNLSEAKSFITCLLSQNINDKEAFVLNGSVRTIYASFSAVFQKLKKVLLQFDEGEWECMLQAKQLSKFSYILNEWRGGAGFQLSEEKEDVIAVLSADGYHAWGEFYQVLLGEMKIDVTSEGTQNQLSVAQTINLRAHEDENVRKQAFHSFEEALIARENSFAKILNHMAGFRLQVYEKRGWENILQETLQENRIKQETLDAMWCAISKHKQPFVKYLKQKAKFLGRNKMYWHNLWAPVMNEDRKMTYDEAADFIIKQFHKFGPQLGQFTERAFQEGWIDAENRSNKRLSGFCVGFPLSEQSRVLLNYDGTMINVATIAHELGHAFHFHAMQEVEGLNRQYAMNVAETASTFAEMIVFDGALKEANTVSEKLSILEEKIKRSVMNFMNIHARFLFETRFYEERKKGFVSPKRLSELMETALHEGYADALYDVQPHYWAAVPHFYITDTPFYNFPYTFGYLFSLSLYAKAVEEGAEFEKNYMSLLRDSGSMSAEDLVHKHIGEDITAEAFWEKGIALCMKDVEEFVRLSNIRE